MQSMLETGNPLPNILSYQDNYIKLLQIGLIMV